MTWATSVPILVILGLSVVDLGPMYATDRRQTAAAVSVGTYWPWETTGTLRSARLREALRCPQREERGGAYRGGRPPTSCYFMRYIAL